MQDWAGAGITRSDRVRAGAARWSALWLLWRLHWAAPDRRRGPGCTSRLGTRLPAGKGARPGLGSFLRIWRKRKLARGGLRAGAPPRRVMASSICIAGTWNLPRAARSLISASRRELGPDSPDALINAR